jgi:pimeloyl-ACP methyl ester carboxylesterase
MRAVAVVRWPLLAEIGVIAALVSLGAGCARADRPALANAHACPSAPKFTCSELSVPVDHSGKVAGTLRLRVAVANDARARKGVLLVLTGGPGEPGVPFVSQIARRLAPVLGDYRNVMLDQRGTGAGALVCPPLQAQIGASDLRPPKAAAVRACAARIGTHRRFYTTLDSSADLELLRRALGVKTWVVDGSSYGSYVAARYGLLHPDHTAKLVLDSVVPQDGMDMLAVPSMHTTARVLRDACRREHCGSDPAADIARIVRKERNGPALLDALVLQGIVDPTYTQNADIPSLLQSATQGLTAPLDAFIADVVRGSSWPAGMLSQGLHASTLCADQRGPWGASSVPVGARFAAVKRALARLPLRAVWPFDRRTARLNGFLQTCLYWPATRAAPAPSRSARLLPPTLILAGAHDLSTPVEWARHEATLAPHSQLVVVPQAGHSIQTRDASGRGLRALARFLDG